MCTAPVFCFQLSHSLQSNMSRSPVCIICFLMCVGGGGGGGGGQISRLIIIY